MKMKKGKTNGRSVIAFWPDSADAFRRDLPVAALPPCAMRIQTRRQDGMALADVEEMTPLESWSGDAAAAEALLETARMLREKGWCVPLTPELVMTDGQGALRIVALPYREPSPGSIEELRARLLPPDDFDSFVEDSFDSFEPDSAGNGLPAAPARTEAQAGAGLNGPAAGFFDAPSGQGGAQTGSGMNGPAAGFFGTPSGQGGGAVKNDPETGFFGAPSGQGGETAKNDPAASFFGAPSGQDAGAVKNDPAASFFGAPSGQGAAQTGTVKNGPETDFFGAPVQAPPSRPAAVSPQFTDFFGNPVESTAGAAVPQPSQFTDFFGNPAQAPENSDAVKPGQFADFFGDPVQAPESSDAVRPGQFTDFFGNLAQAPESSDAVRPGQFTDFFGNPAQAPESSDAVRPAPYADFFGGATEPSPRSTPSIPGGFMDFFGMPAEEPASSASENLAEPSPECAEKAAPTPDKPQPEEAAATPIPGGFMDFFGVPAEEPASSASESLAEPSPECAEKAASIPDETQPEQIAPTPIPSGGFMDFFGVPAEEPASSASENLAAPSPECAEKAASIPDETQPEQIASTPIPSGGFMDFFGVPAEEPVVEAAVENAEVSSVTEPVAENYQVSPITENAAEQSVPETLAVSTETTSADDFFSMWSTPEEEPTAEAVVGDMPIQLITEPAEENIPVSLSAEATSPTAEPVAEQSVPETPVVTTEAAPEPTPFEETASADDFFSMWSTPEEEPTAEAVVEDTPIPPIAEPAEKSIPVPLAAEATSHIAEPAVEQSAPEMPVVTTEAPPEPTTFEETASVDDFFSMWSMPEEDPTVEAVVGDTPSQPTAEPAEESIPVPLAAEPVVEQSAPETPVVTTEATPDPTSFEETTSADDFFSMWSTPEEETAEAVVGDMPIPPTAELSEENIPVSLSAEATSPIAEPAVEQSAPETPVVTTEATPDPTSFEETASADDFFSMWSTPEEELTAAAVAENPPSQPAAESVAEAAVGPTSHVGQDDPFSGGYARSTWDMVEDEPRPDSAPTSHVEQDDPFSGGYAHSTWDMVEDEPHPDSAPTSYVEQDDPFSGGYAHRSWDQAADGARPDSAPVSYDVQDNPFDGNGAWGEPEADVPAQDAPEASNGEAKQDPFRGKDGWESFSTAQDDDPFNMFTDGQPQPEERREDRRGRREKDGEPRERGGLLGFIRKKRAERSDEIDPDDPLMEFIDESGVQKRTASGQLYLSKKKGTTRGAIRVPREPSVVIGRTQGRGRLVIGDREISEEHAEISFDHGAYYLTDLNSTNGTFVNGEPLAQGRSVQLNQMDEISFGTKRFYALFVEEK